MSQELELQVHSNISALSAERIHRALVDMVNSTVRHSAEFLRADRELHSRSGLTAEHVGSTEVEEIAGVIEAKLGVSAVTEKDERPTHGLYQHSQAPIFTDEGTRSPIFPARAKTMWNREEGIFGRRSVRGQEGQHFMAKTYAEAQLLLRSDTSLSRALAEMQARADAMAIEIEAT